MQDERRLICPPPQEHTTLTEFVPAEKIAIDQSRGRQGQPMDHPPPSVVLIAKVAPQPATSTTVAVLHSTAIVVGGLGTYRMYVCTLPTAM